jgi:lysine-ketoglutarate reductase/saccharopine dehydrogenase-like protein (TIGR00300 family)
MNRPVAEKKPRFLMCRPDHFSVEYVINPWMDGNVGRTSAQTAMEQWKALHEIVSSLADVELINQGEGLPDMVFTANGGLALGESFILSHFARSQRQPEEPHYRKWFEGMGFEIHTLPHELLFEGGGDALFDTDGRRLWVAYGDRTSLESHPYIAKILDIEVVSLRLTDKRFYHLDTCLLPLPGGRLLYYPDALDTESNREIERIVPEVKRIAISNKDAVAFSANAICIGKTIVMNRCSDELKQKLESEGFDTVETDLSEFMKAGGSAKCLTLRLNETVAGGKSASTTVSARKVVVEGQLIDSDLMSRICDTIIDGGGSFYIHEIHLGRKRNELSTAEIEISAPTESVLERLVQKAVRLGARLPQAEATDVSLEVTADGVAPENFYSTTIYKTEVRINGKWTVVARLRMDGVIVVSDGVARCELIRNLNAGDLVVTGSGGIRVTRPVGGKGERESFGFMASGISSERRVELAVERIAWEMNRIRNGGGRVVVVAGPVVIHTGCSPHLAWLARNGYINALLGGNGTAVHDIEQSLYGTSLGVDMKTGRQVEGGHRNHIAAINRIRRLGSIKAAVEDRLLTSGLFYDLVKNSIPFALAGSIRDDGPLPDTEMDLIKAQAAYAELVEGADMTLMLSSMLHSIGTGNMTPADVKLVCVDINPAVVTKLADRGSLESIGVVTDVGLFLSQLVKRLKEFGEGRF